jgi:alpha-beta hydrolase superfamily lysophospholipase
MVPYLMHEPTRTGEIVAAGGVRLFLRNWSVATGRVTKGSALLVHGLGEHGGRYGHVAHALNELGIEVWAHDHRGFGRSEGKRARIPERDALLADTKLVFETCWERSGGAPPILLGHSMGGAIAARAVTGGLIAPRALVLSSPGLKSHINGFMRSLAAAMEAVLPNLALPHGLPLHKITHDAEVLANAATDTLNHALISPRLTNFILDAGEAAIRDAGKLAVPTLIQAAGDDKLVDADGAREFALAAMPGLCTLKVYEGLWHEIYNEREHDRAAVLADLKDWLSRVALR